MIQAGDADIVVAGGMESMTQAPYLLPGARAGYRIGDGTLVDSMMYDGLTDAFDHIAMGLVHRAVQRSRPQHHPRAPGRVRRRQSHEKAAAAIKDGRLAEEIVAGAGPPAQGRPARGRHRRGRAARDDGRVAWARSSRRSTKNGTITAGNASQISDGGAAVIVMSAARPSELGVTPLGEIVGYGQVAGPDTSLLHPAVAGHPQGRREGRASTSATIDLFEINEAFAAVGLASADDLGIDEDLVNVNGGAIALGHPVGMSGTRLALTALLELRRRGGGVGAVALCGGGGQGDAATLRTREAATVDSSPMPWSGRP